MNHIAPSQVTSKASLRLFSIQLLSRWVTLLDRNRIRLHLPQPRGLMRLIPGMPFHLRPELFLQISGGTTFEFPEETCKVGPEEICLVSRGLPHRETIRLRKQPFYNLVFAYTPDHVHYHLAHENEEGIPAIVISQELSGLDGQHLSDQLKNLGEWQHEGDAAHRLAVKGSLLANLATVLAAIKQPPSDVHEPFKVMQARQLIMQYLSDARLSPDWIGRSLRSSPDYLSRLFRRATGRPLVAYITEKRMARARELLASTPLNISEISRAAGYDDPSYFTRVFRRETGIAPRSYRLRTGLEMAGRD